jgi:hypothetical protein
MKVEDLDVLRPESRFIKLGDKEIDVSFIPCGITFEVDRIVQELSSINKDSLLENGDDTKRAFELSVKLCSLFCERKHPEMNEEWFNDNVDALQIKKFTSTIQEALTRAYNGIQANSKNLKAPRKKSR